MQGKLTFLMHGLPFKPSVKRSNAPFINKFPGKYTGALVISADFEMAWAWRYSKNLENPVKKGMIERQNIPILLEMFEQYNFPVTWATVGHLFLKECKKTDGIPHANLKRIPHFTNKVWSFLNGDWFEHDPCSNLSDEPSWYAPDLINLIIANQVPHEIGCHTFSHIACTNELCPPEVMENEIKECVYLAKKKGIELKSMVFPGGTNGNYQVLKKYGFINYRINSNWDLFYPEKDSDGLWKIPSSAAIENHGFGWSSNYYENYYKKYIDKAIKTGTVCHLWFHPCIDQFCLYEIFPKILQYAVKKRNEGKLWICTMEKLASFCEDNQQNLGNFK